MVEMQRNAVGEERFAILDMVQGYVRGLEGRIGTSGGSTRLFAASSSTTGQSYSSTVPSG